MQKSVNPIVATLVIAFFGGLIVLYICAGQQWLQLDKFGLAKKVDDDSFVVQYGNKLLWINKDFSVERELSLGTFGQQSFTGDIDFFANGDLLLALDQQPQRIAQKLAVLSRSTNRKTDGEGKLYRCNTESLTCVPFGKNLPAINRTFRLYIDEQDQVYLADTSRHQLWLLDKDGNILANKTGFRFPNQLVPQGKNLVLADTNHHALKIIKSSVNEFGAETRKIPVGLDSLSDWFNKGKQQTYSWPVDVVWEKNTYWVLVGDDNLANSRLALYNIAGKFDRELKLPEDADPISILAFDNKVLVVDMALYQLHQFSTTGDFLGSVTIAGANNTFIKNAKEARMWKNLQDNSIIVFALFLVLGFIAAIINHFRSRHGLQKISMQQQKLQAFKEIGERGIWLDVKPTLRRSAMFTPVLVVMVVLCMAVLFWLNPRAVAHHIPHISVLGTLIIFSIPYMQATRWRLGIFQDRIELIDHKKISYSQYYDHLVWNDYAFKVDKVVVPFRQNARGGFFPHQEIMAFAVPFFEEKNKVSKIAMLKYQWHSPEKMMKVTVLVVVCFVVAFIFQKI